MPFHVIKLANSKKLQRLHNTLLEAQGKGQKLSSLELAMRTKLVCVSTYASHLRANGVNVQSETFRQDGETRWRYWIAKEGGQDSTASDAGAP